MNDDDVDVIQVSVRRFYKSDGPIGRIMPTASVVLVEEKVTTADLGTLIHRLSENAATAVVGIPLANVQPMTRAEARAALDDEENEGR